MTSYEEIFEAMNTPKYAESVSRVKAIAARALREADESARLFMTEYFNHTYVPDFIMKWPDRPDRFVFLRASSFAGEIQDDVVRLADQHPMFVQLSEFTPVNSEPIRPAIESLDRSASAAKSLVATMPAIGYLDDSPRTGKMLSSFVMRGGSGVIEDSEAQVIAAKVETGLDGAIHQNRETTRAAIEAVEGILDPRSTADFNHVFEAAWISSGAPAADFPGGVTSIGDAVSSAILSQLLGIVPETFEEFWQQIGKSITPDAFEGMNLVGDQPRLQQIMKTAGTRINASKCGVRRTLRSDQEEDPFLWQVEKGFISLRGGGYQAWVGPPAVRAAIGAGADYSVDEPPSLSGLAARAQSAGIALTDINVIGNDGIAVLFKSQGREDVTTSDLLGRVSESLSNVVQVQDVVAVVHGKPSPVDYQHGFAGVRTNSSVPVSDLIWSAWNLLAETSGETRDELQLLLGLGGDQPTDNPDETDAFTHNTEHSDRDSSKSDIAPTPEV